MTDIDQTAAPELQSGELSGGWITDVVTLTTITSTWGNNMRNRVVHQAGNAGDYGTIVAACPVGTWVCKLYDGGSLWQKQGAGMVEMVGATRTFAPHRFEGNTIIDDATAVDYCEYRRDNGWVTYTGLFHWTGIWPQAGINAVTVDLPFPAVRGGIAVGSFHAYDATRNINYGGNAAIAPNGGLGGFVHGSGPLLGAPGTGFDEQKGTADAVSWTARYRTATVT